MKRREKERESEEKKSEVLVTKYGRWKRLKREEATQHASFWQRDLCKICGGCCNLKWFDDMVRRKVRRGNNTKFWSDIWVGDQAW